MKEKIFIVSNEREEVFHLTEVITDMMESENLTQLECINYFMEGLGGSRYIICSMETPSTTIIDWIVNDYFSFKIPQARFGITLMQRS